MTHTKDALKQAIEAIKNNAGNPERVYQLANAALKEALAQPAPVRGFEKAIDEYLDDYEMIGEDEDGRDACHSPTEGEKALIKDAIMGFDWSPAAPAAQPAPVQPEQEPVVFYRCKGCGHAYEQMTRCDCMASDGFDRLEYYTTPPAAPMTEFDLSLIDGLIYEQISASLDWDRESNCELASKQKGFYMDRVALLKKIKATPPAAPVQPEHCSPSSSVFGLAEMILSDCGCSSDYQPLINRVAERIQGYIDTPPAAQPAMFGPMGTVGDLFDKHVIANGNLKKEWIVYLEKNT